ncbi:TRAP transporter large permease subunit [Paracoccus aerodenitrificans]|uniref:TRAP transporter large permease subunit n=1 Tax=Paracoccus aerodenitrificans TaxID=3017781 RepID=UPI0022F0B0F5|nr:TRAP transporter large permease subunit [Paracoccus aerodenitrificans]WBU64315.1 TRAP transporter large permease subunit [Paracoccus aerodenitrificans]
MTTTRESDPEVVTPPVMSRVISALSGWVGMLAVLLMLLSVNIEVIGRSLFDHATIWVTEVSTYLVVVITFAGTAFVASRDGNIRVDLLLDRFSAVTQTLIRAALTWISVFIALIALWKFSSFWMESLANGTRSWSLLNTPLWIPQLSVMLGLVAMILALIWRTPSALGQIAYLPALAAIALALLQGSGVFLGQLSVSQNLIAQAILVSASAALAGGARTIGLIALYVLPVIALFLVTRDAGLTIKSLALISILFFLLFAGLPVAFALMGIGIFAMIFWLKPVTLNSIGERAWTSVNTFELAAIPMFVMMGTILVRSNASGEMFAATQAFMGRLRGGLAYASLLASGIFAAVSGSSLATAATMGRVAGPEMMKSGYRAALAYGVLAAGGTLGILIPPSIAMIIYGPMAGVPVTELFMAGIIPGLLMIAAFTAVVLVWALIDPTACPAADGMTLREKLTALKGVVPFLLLMAMVLGSLYAGIATPTEAGAVGVLGAILLSLFRGSLSIEDFIGALEETVMTTSFLLIIAVGASVMGFAIDFLAMPQALVKFVESLALSKLGLFLAIVVLYLILGMFVEPISMVLMTLPVILPVIAAAGWDPLWFGIVLVMLVEIGLITPPVGMILYILSGVSQKGTTMWQISVGTLPFVIAFLAMVLLFFAVPQLVTFLPVMMR